VRTLAVHSRARAFQAKVFKTSSPAFRSTIEKSGFGICNIAIRPVPRPTHFAVGVEGDAASQYLKNGRRHGRRREPFGLYIIFDVNSLLQQTLIVCSETSRKGRKYNKYCLHPHLKFEGNLCRID